MAGCRLFSNDFCFFLCLLLLSNFHIKSASAATRSLAGISLNKQTSSHGRRAGDAFCHITIFGVGLEMCKFDFTWRVTAGCSVSHLTAFGREATLNPRRQPGGKWWIKVTTQTPSRKKIYINNTGNQKTVKTIHVMLLFWRIPQTISAEGQTSLLSKNMSHLPAGLQTAGALAKNKKRTRKSLESRRGEEKKMVSSAELCVTVAIKAELNGFLQTPRADGETDLLLWELH